MVKLVNGEQVMGKVVEMKIVREDTPFGRATLVLEEVATFQTGRHPQKQNELIYNLLQWQTQETYIPWDKVIAFGVASEMAQDYYRQVFQRVQMADINEVKAMTKGRPGEKLVIEVP
jgi:hypothetical protein